MTPALRAVTWAVRAWTKLYTCGVTPAVRDARRAEIESDLWEHLKERDGRPMLSIEMILRLLLGIRDDVSWSLERAFADSNYLRSRILAVVSSILLLGSLWLAAFVMPAQTPDPPPAPDLRWRRSRPPYPPPPPPPPPPCSPRGIGPAPRSPCTR